MAPPAATTTTTDATTTAPSLGDMEDLGSVVVTQKCTGCVVCRVLAPDVFLEAHAGSRDPTVFTEAVDRPIKSEAEFHAVRRAVMACPVAAIKWVKRPKLKARPLQEGYPQRLQENVYAAGVPSHKLFGGMGYLIKGEGGRMKGRNILVDTPDADPALVEAIRAMGGLEYMVFTHRDHIGCHAEWHAAFPEAKRVLHPADMVVGEHGDTSGFEMVLPADQGQTTWTLPGWEDQALQLIHLPGHTPGSVFVQYKERFLFTGDSLHYSRVDGRLSGFRLHCWQDWALQVASWRKLLDYQFQYVLPGHGEPHRFESPHEARRSLEACIEWAAALSPGHTPMWRFRLWAAARVAYKNQLLKYLADRFVLGASRQGLPAFAPTAKKAGGEKWGFVAVSSPAALGVLAAVGVACVGVGVAAVRRR